MVYHFEIRRPSMRALPVTAIAISPLSKTVNEVVAGTVSTLIMAPLLHLIPHVVNSPSKMSSEKVNNNHNPMTIPLNHGLQ